MSVLNLRKNEYVQSVEDAFHYTLIDSKMDLTPANSSSANVSSQQRSRTTFPSGVYKYAANL
jgi:hypothetical protein